MPRKTATFDTVREMGLALPGVEDGTVFGAMALEVQGRMFACVATHKSAEPNSLVVCIDFDQRDELIAADPKTYYLMPHFVSYACVLVRLREIDRDALQDLLLMAWRFVSAKNKRRRQRRP